MAICRVWQHLLIESAEPGYFLNCYGAAYFEQQLLDYDVASNWGNWQYLAGVGADPRGNSSFGPNSPLNCF